jgi:tRNA G18 (ribose-2'-O)-methylase SpoU
MIEKIGFEELVKSRPTLDEAQKLPRHPIYGIVDNVRSLYNVGSIFRTADGAGLRKLYLCGITGCPPNNEIHKTALGAEENINWEYVQNPVDAVLALKQAGIKIVILEHTYQSQHFQRATFQFPACLVVGHEHTGVSEDVTRLADLAIEIPMFGLKGSLNVGVAFGIAIYQMVGQLTL